MKEELEMLESLYMDKSLSASVRGAIEGCAKSIESQYSALSEAVTACLVLFSPHGPVTHSKEWQAAWNEAEAKVYAASAYIPK